MSYRLLSGGIAVALAVACAIPGIAQASSAAPETSQPASASWPASASAAPSAAAGPQANAVRTVDGRQVVVPLASTPGAWTPRPVPSGPVLYVNSKSGSGCSDTSGSAGTQAVPFCTLQTAANNVVAGDTVLVTPGVYAGFTLSAQGTADAPITFESSMLADVPNNNESIVIQVPRGTGTTTTPAHAIDLEGSSYVDLENFNVEEAVTSDALLVNASHQVTVNEFMDWVAYNAPGQSGADIHMAGGSSHVTITRVSEFNGSGPYVQVDAGGSNVTIADSAFQGNRTTPITVAGTPNTEITGNTVWTYNSTAISLTGTSPGSTVENNIVVATGTGSSARTASIMVGTGATSDTTLDYNVVQPRSSPVYQWGTATYTSAAALHSATGQGVHEINAPASVSINGNALVLNYNSAGINAANAAAPGEQATDIHGQSCVEDPSYPVTGAGTPAYCSRGSFQFQDPLSALLTAAATGTMSAKADATKSHGLHAVTSYSFDFGDGSAPVVNSTGLATHPYAHSGQYAVTVTIIDSTGATNTSDATWVVTLGSDFTALAPVRVLDTRHGIGSGTAVPVRAGSAVSFPVPAAAGAHGNWLHAVALNVTVADATGNGYIGLGTGTSNLNYVAGKTSAAMVIAQPSNTNGTAYVTLFNTGVGTVDLIADMTGFFATDSSDGYQPITPARIMDTRQGIGGSTGPLTSGRPDVLTVAGADKGVIPSTGVTAVAVNLTVTKPVGGGLVAAYPDGSTAPGTSNINYGAGQTLSNFAIVPVGADGKIDLANAGADTHLVIDVVGYFDSNGGSGFIASDPYRDIDTRSGNPADDCNSAKGALAPNHVLTADVVCPSAAEPPTSDLGTVTAVAVNTTMTAGTSSGYLTVYPAGGTRPTTSNVNWQHAKQTVANFTFAGTGKAGGISFANTSSGTAQLIVDVYGYFAAN